MSSQKRIPGHAVALLAHDVLTVLLLVAAVLLLALSASPALAQRRDDDLHRKYVVQRPDLGLHMVVPAELSVRTMPGLRNALKEQPRFRMIRARFDWHAIIRPNHPDLRVEGTVSQLPLVAGATLAPCGRVEEGFALAQEILAKIQSYTERVLELTERAILVSHQPEEVREIVDKVIAIVDEIVRLAAQLDRVYPASFNVVDRRYVYEWALGADRLGLGANASWFPRRPFLAESIALPGFTWTAGQGRVTDLPGIPYSPVTDGSIVRFERLLSAVGACLNDTRVQLAGPWTFQALGREVSPGVIDSSASGAKIYDTLLAAGTPPRS